LRSYDSDALLQHRDSVVDSLAKRKSLLNDANLLFSFFRDLDEVNLHRATLIVRRSNLFPRSLCLLLMNRFGMHRIFEAKCKNSKLPFHMSLTQVFEAELALHAEHVSGLERVGSELVARSHYAQDAISSRIERLRTVWQGLCDQTKEKGTRTRWLLTTRAALARGHRAV
jgi:hypothetical protein